MARHISVSIQADRPYVSLLSVIALKRGITVGELIRQTLDRDKDLAREMKIAGNFIANIVESNHQDKN